MLKQLKLQALLKQRQSELTNCLEKKEALSKRAEELKQALDEAQTEEDLKMVTEEIDAFEKENASENLAEKIGELESEISRITQELEELAERSKTTTQKENHEERGENANMNRYQIRELLKSGAYYERAEVKEFYDKFRNLRAVGGQELAIPEVIVNRIMDIMGDYTTLYPLVDKIRVNGKTRILIDTDTTAATWIEQTGTLADGDTGTITNISFDGYKIGKVTFVDNSMLQDSIVNLDEYVARKLARAIALGLDAAILKGTGDKQPDGIIPKLPAANKVTVKDPTGFADITKPIAKIDTGADSTGEIVAVMSRTTYYNRLLQYSIQSTSAGEVVAKMPNLNAPDLLGLRVVFNNNMDDDKILFGDFSKYTLVERETITIDKSEHVKFSEDQMAFRGKGRFDGRPTKPGAFVLVTLTFTTPAG
jgi:HK97 family phage major capsid protein